MAKASKEEKDDADLDDADASEEERDEAESSEEEGAEERSSAEDEGAEEGEEEASAESPEKGEAAEKKTTAVTLQRGGDKELAIQSSEEEEEEEAAAQLGIQRYVLASFFAAGIVGAYVLGKAVHGAWSWASNKDWFHNALPSLAAVDDEKKATWGTIIGAVVAIVAVIRTYQRPSVRTWADEVASELAKVKWPSRKEVSSSTIVVIAAGAVATLYLALLDRLWSFVTDLFYGTGS